MGGQLRLPVIDSFKSVDHEDVTPKNVISGAQGLLMLMGSRYLIKMNRLQNILFFYYLKVLRPAAGHLYQKF